MKAPAAALLLILAGCAAPSAPGAPAPREADAAQVDAEPRDPLGALRGLLRARHPADLPTRQALLQHGGAPALRALAEGQEDWLVAVRATELVGRVGGPADAAWLAARVDDPALPERLRVAAVHGLMALPAELRAPHADAVARLAAGEGRLAREAALVVGRLAPGDASGPEGHAAHGAAPAVTP